MSSRSSKAGPSKRRRVTESVLPSATIEKLNSVLDRLASAPLDPDTVPVDPELMALQSAKHKMENAKSDDDIKFQQAKDAYMRLYEKRLSKSTVAATTKKIAPPAAAVNRNAEFINPAVLKQEQHERSYDGDTEDTEEEEEEQRSERSDEDTTEGYAEDSDNTTKRKIFPGVLRCKTCGKEMHSRAGLTKHMNSAHKQWQGKGGTPKGATRVKQYEWGEASKRT